MGSSVIISALFELLSQKEIQAEINRQTWERIKPTILLLLLPPLLCQLVSQQTQCQLSLYIVSPKNKNMPAPSLDNRCKVGKVQ